MPQRPEVLVRRVYGDGSEDDAGCRVLVDRIWPRGVRKADARLTEWLKDVAPTTELRRWYGHEPERFEEFARRYRAELRRPPASDAFAHLADLARTGRLTLVTATRDVERSAARVLQVELGRAEDRAARSGPATASRRADESAGRRRTASAAGRPR
jgi:uncharacterized protein YeaO (DUF488 family)